MATALNTYAAGVVPNAASAAIEVHEVTKEYGEGDSRVQVLKGVDLCIARGEMLAIMGPSGSGKSTLLGAISGLDTVTSGQVIVNGTDITRLGENALASVRNRNIGFIFQTFNLIGTLSAQENVELPILLDPKSRFKPSKRAQELLEVVGLSHRRKHRPGQMSGGEQQRVAIARALANDPEILFGDEPTGNLDSFNGEAVMQLLTQLKEQTGKTLVLVTHDPRIAAQCDRAVYMQDGRFLDESDGHQSLRSSR
jgi:putative ABC transport system ATP-binding protein